MPEPVSDEVEDGGEEPVVARLNASEDAVAWAIAQFGAGRELVRSMRRESRAGLRAVLDALPDDEASRILELEQWREDARIADRIERWASAPTVDGESESGRWAGRVDALLRHGPSPGHGATLRAQLAVLGVEVGDDATLEWPRDSQPEGPVGLRTLSEMELDALRDELRRIGVWQFSAIVAGHGRRRIARVRAKIPEQWSDDFQAGLEQNEDLSAAATTRIQEVYLGLNRRGFGFVETVEQLGLFAVVSACGGRFERRLDVWLRRVPEDIAASARQLVRLNDRPLRLRTGAAFRTSLERFWEHRRSPVEQEEVHDE